MVGGCAFPAELIEDLTVPATGDICISLSTHTRSLYNIPFLG